MGTSGESDGPFYEDGVMYAEVGGDDRELTMYHSRAWIEHICNSPGSPLVVMDRDEHAALLARVHLMEIENDDLRQSNDEHGNTPSRDASPIDVEALTNSLAAVLDERYARKPGRKKAAA